MRNILNDLGVSYYGIHKVQVEQVSQMLYDQYCQEWYSELDKSNTLDTLK